jgi:hypothetical protein
MSLRRQVLNTYSFAVVSMLKFSLFALVEAWAKLIQTLNAARICLCDDILIYSVTLIQLALCHALSWRKSVAWAREVGSLAAVPFFDKLGQWPIMAYLWFHSWQVDPYPRMKTDWQISTPNLVQCCQIRYLLLIWRPGTVAAWTMQVSITWKQLFKFLHFFA